VELEQRVKALEYEMKIVKNEIQRTLLDIQEQLLVHYYPALRLEESTVPKNVADTVDSLRAKSAAAEISRPASVPSAEVPKPATSTPIPEAPPSPPTTIKKVSLEEVRSIQEHLAQESPAPSSPNMMSLVDWATKSVVRLGTERVNGIIQVYSKKSYIAVDTKNVMLQIASLNTAPAPDKVSADDVLSELIKLDTALGRSTDPDAARALMQESGLG
jgi:hypothetical protein